MYRFDAPCVRHAQKSNTAELTQMSQWGFCSMTHGVLALGCRSAETSEHNHVRKK